MRCNHQLAPAIAERLQATRPEKTRAIENQDSQAWEAGAHGMNAYLFNSYYNAAGPRHCRDRRGVITRPTVSETR